MSFDLHLLWVKRGAFLACTDNVHVVTESQPNIIRGLMSGAGLFVVRASSSGSLGQVRADNETRFCKCLSIDDQGSENYLP